MKRWTDAVRGLIPALVLLFIAPGAASAATCRDMTYRDDSFTVCEAQADEDVRLFLNRPDGTPLGSFGAINSALAETGQTLAFAMNAGMYHDNRRPVGYFVADGQEMAPLQRRPGPGNFGLHPNGVFCVTQGGFAVVETLAFDAARPDCRFASQSGPMLVLSGALHPKFLADSDSLNIRNGVGVSRDGKTAWFVISNDPVNFYRFASFFRDELGAPDALFFDGTISRLYAPEIGRDDFGLPMGPIVGLVVTAQ